MKSLFILSFALLVGFSTFFGQEKAANSGNILFHTITKKGVKANTQDFESKIDLSARSISLTVPVKSFKSESSSVTNKVNTDGSISFVGDINSNSKIEESGRHIVSIQGKMTINGITNPFKFNGLLENKNGVVVFSASFLVNGKKYGMNEEMIKEFTDKVEVSLSVTY